jgi:hypothetical protein
LYREASAFSCRIGEHLILLEHQPEIEDAREYQEQERERHRELHKLGPVLAAPAPVTLEISVAILINTLRRDLVACFSNNEVHAAEPIAVATDLMHYYRPSYG